MRLLCRSLPKGAGIYLLLLLFLTPLFTLAQSPVTGTVKDTTGGPLAGVSVSVRGKNTVAITNASGAFTINASTGDVLVFSGVSLLNQEIRVTGSPISITMKSTALMMGDVVVVGYGKGSRKTLSSAITSVKPDDLNKGAIGDVGQLLQGKVPGLNITASGDPNKTAAIILRGASTINSPAGPFYVIDGIPGADINAVSPDDIASIDVLKDASATAIYGNKASNGVIMVSTKRGKKGALQTVYSGYVGFESISNKLDMMDADQLRAYVAKNNATISTADDKGANTDWQKAVQKSSAFSHNHNISFSGGNDKSTYSASLNYLNKEGIMLQSGLERVNARISAEHHALNDHVIFGMNISSSNSKASNVPLQNMVFQQALKYNPTSPVYNSDGTYFENLNNSGYFNPVSILKNATDDTKYTSLQGNFTIEAKLPFGFTYNANIAYQKGTSLHGEYYNSYYSKNYSGGQFYVNGDPGNGRSLRTFYTGGLAYRNYYQNSSKTLESYLTWAKHVGLHNIKAVVGYSWQENTLNEGLQASQTNFVSDYSGYNNFNLGNYASVSGFQMDFGTAVYQTNRFISDFARVNYDFNEKYLFQASIRRDGSSVFGANNYWGYFPSVGAAWRISQEDFMKNVSLINELKLRASYGETGNAFGLNAYSAAQLYNKTSTYYSNGSYASSFGFTQGSNPDLKWEVTSTKNLGLDYSIWGGKISGAIDVYEKLTTGMIFGYSVPQSVDPSGFLNMNVGKIRNRGIEFSVSVNAIDTKDFNWTSTLNLASNKNLIMNLKGPAKYGVNADSLKYTAIDVTGISGNTTQIMTVGGQLGQFYSFQYAGKSSAGKSQFVAKDGSLTENPAIGTDYHSIGNPQPKLMFGWQNNFRYKNFDLNIFFRGVTGNKIFNVTRADMSYVYTAGVTNVLQSAADDVKGDIKNNYTSSRYVEDGSYIRLDNATLGYRFKFKSQYVSSVRCYATVNNAFVITKYKGIDPEITQGGASLGVDFNSFYPKTRTILLGVSVGF
jgi:TonB-dependent starch-binding outer membrane protein SusC